MRVPLNMLHTLAEPALDKPTDPEKTQNKTAVLTRVSVNFSDGGLLGSRLPVMSVHTFFLYSAMAPRLGFI